MQLGWIDFSRNERNRILQTLKLLEESAALDELGIGVIRDEFADILFPGISTLQTRAKYFVLLPYLFGMAEKENFKRSSEVLPWINKQEDLLVSTLIKNSEDKNGIIGLRAHNQGKSVKVKPSSIYWNGMRTFEIIRDEHLSISNVCNIIFGKGARRNALSIKTETKRKDDEGFDDETAVNEGSAVFSAIPPGYSVMTDADMKLTGLEAEFLYQKITTAKKSRGSLLAFMLKEKCVFPTFEELDETILPNELADYVSAAKGFADFIYGAHLRYNVIYSAGEDKVDEYREWRETFDFKGFDLSAVLKKVTANPPLSAFLKEFYKLSQRRDLSAADRLIVEREKAIKRDRAKLLKPQEYRYDFNRPTHYYKLNYRYHAARKIADDILAGMEGK